MVYGETSLSVKLTISRIFSEHVLEEQIPPKQRRKLFTLNFQDGYKQITAEQMAGPFSNLALIILLGALGSILVLCIAIVSACLYKHKKELTRLTLAAAAPESVAFSAALPDSSSLKEENRVSGKAAETGILAIPEPDVQSITEKTPQRRKIIIH